jgi:hypothetical protein
MVSDSQQVASQPLGSYLRPSDETRPSPFGFPHPSYPPAGAPRAPSLPSQPSTPTHSDYSSRISQQRAASAFSSPFPPHTTTSEPAAQASATSDFAPLITAISSRPPHPAPLRSLIGGLVTQIDRHAFARVGVTCAKDYFTAAKEAGIVEMGYGDVSGADWSTFDDHEVYRPDLSPLTESPLRVCSCAGRSGFDFSTLRAAACYGPQSPS